MTHYGNDSLTTIQSSKRETKQIAENDESTRQPEESRPDIGTSYGGRALRRRVGSQLGHPIKREPGTACRLELDGLAGRIDDSTTPAKDLPDATWDDGVLDARHGLEVEDRVSVVEVGREDEDFAGSARGGDVPYSGVDAFRGVVVDGAGRGGVEEVGRDGWEGSGEEGGVGFDLGRCGVFPGYDACLVGGGLR